ncbi:hypothetical protein FOMPIDRAFT_1049025 [Fomitopsis schrenkii]|uniref:Uncharacterized protein n=1 Tax=Fomitopsis schrenkii TaxID=2126942 RepID=S8FIS0_FOMSC|nr:hypothetical protein FOMPIDRAFT_1049025 [Fomitopsis schrenkii]
MSEIILARRHPAHRDSLLAAPSPTTSPNTSTCSHPSRPLFVITADAPAPRFNARDNAVLPVFIDTLPLRNDYRPC